MKFKNISKLLTIGILFNSTPFNSFAGTLSPDTRYEIFEGDNITIPDILEENNVDIEIEGNTLVNLLSEDINLTSSVLLKDGYRHFKTANTYDHLIFKGKIPYKPSTKYTIVADVVENTYVNDVSISPTDATVFKDSGVIIKAKTNGRNFLVLETKDNLNLSSILYDLWLWHPHDGTGDFKARIMILEGDWTNREIPEYFEGIKSVGQNDNNSHKIEILSSKTDGVSLALEQLEIGYINDFGSNVSSNIGFRTKDFIKYPFKYAYVDVKNPDYLCRGIHCYDKNKKWLGRIERNLPVLPGTYYIKTNFRHKNSIVINDIIDGMQFSIKNTAFIYTSESKLNKKEIHLNEPLRGLPNGAKDKIVKKNGKWVIERNCKEIILNGSENWILMGGNWVFDNTYGFRVPFADMVNSQQMNTIQCDKLPVYNGNALSTNSLPNDIEMIGNDLAQIGIRISKTKLTTGDADGFKQWLQSNPLTVVYQLKTPIYEPLKIEPTLNIYTDTTHISNNSVIPATMKVTVDRILNRATEAVELAKTNPTMENLSIARMWTNLAKESIKKDELQSEINDISNIEDLKLERKSVTSNLDVYVKSENMLSMSLNTNSITFENYSGVEDMEMLGAVNISINSSLPYDLNAYLPSEIANSDKSNIIDMDILNIKESNESVYQRFTNTTDKIVLKDGCNAGNNLIHNIDLKLASNQAHKADVYKTVIKFEAEQK